MLATSPHSQESVLQREEKEDEEEEDKEEEDEEEEDEEEEDEEEDDDSHYLGEETVTSFSFTPDDNDAEEGWEEFDPEQLPDYTNYPKQPEGGDDYVPSPILDDKEAEMIW